MVMCKCDHNETCPICRAGIPPPYTCRYCAAHVARIRELEEMTRELKADVNRYIERDETWREKKRVLENDLAKAWEEARLVCGALGEFYGKGQGTAVEKINFMRRDHDDQQEVLGDKINDQIEYRKYLESRLAALEKMADLCEPFAKEGDEWDKCTDSLAVPIIGHSSDIRCEFGCDGDIDGLQEAQFTLADMRKLRAALAALRASPWPPSSR